MYVVLVNVESRSERCRARDRNRSIGTRCEEPRSMPSVACACATRDEEEKQKKKQMRAGLAPRKRACRQIVAQCIGGRLCAGWLQNRARRSSLLLLSLRVGWRLDCVSMAETAWAKIVANQAVLRADEQIAL